MNAVFNDGFMDILIGIIVEFVAGGDATVFSDGVVGAKLYDVAIIGDNDAVMGDADDIFGHFGVALEHVELAMIGHVIFRLETSDEVYMIFVVGMTR